MTIRIKLRRDTAANWTQANPILAAGEPGLETDTGKIKYGDGVTAWNSLAHSGGDTLNDGKSVTVTVGNTDHWIAVANRDSQNDDDLYGSVVRYDSEGNVYLMTNNDDEDEGYLIKLSPTGAVLWKKQIDDNLDDIAVDADDNVFIATTDNSNADVYKLNGETGSVLWAKSIDSGIANSEFDLCIDIDSSDNLVGVYGHYSGNQDDMYVFKLNGNTGAVIWNKKIENNGLNVNPNGIGTDGFGNVYVTGRISQGQDPEAIFVAKLNSLGGWVWQKKIRDKFYNSWPIYGGDIDVDALGNITLGVEFEVPNVNSADNTFTGSAVGVIRMTPNGSVAWARKIGPGRCETVLAGIAAGDNGEAYISSIMWQPPDSEVFSNTEYEWDNRFPERHVIAKYNSDGSVAWQRQLQFGQFCNLSRNNRQQVGIDIHSDVMAVSLEIEYRKDDNDGDDTKTYVAQLPTDGTLVEIEGWKTVESRVAGRITTNIDVSDSELTISDIINEITVETPTYQFGPGQIGIEVFRSKSYDFVFDNRGSLTLPNDGELRLTQSQLGYFTLIGFNDNDNYDYNGRCIAVDAEGNAYVGGEEEDYDDPTLVKISPEGEKLWSVRIVSEGANLGTGRVNGVRVVGENIHVFGEWYNLDANNVQGFTSVHRIDTGRSVGDMNLYYDDSVEDGDMYLTDGVAVSADPSDGEFIVGTKYGSYIDIANVQPLTGSGSNVFMVNAGSFESSNYPSTSWLISGTGISGYELLDSVNQYNGLTGTVQQGSGAQFSLSEDSGAGTGNYTVLGILTAGTNYRVGHKIKVLGSELGGTDGVNDAIITVDSVDGGGITGASVTGTAFATAPGGGWAVSGANHNVGTGYTLNFKYTTLEDNYSNYISAITTNGGSNYVSGDIITIPGTSLGGISPQNDLTVTVAGVSGGTVTGANFTGTAQTGKIRLGTTVGVDFSAGGTWTLSYPTQRDAFIALPESYAKTFNYGDPQFDDRVYAVAKDDAGFAYIIGETRSQTVMSGVDLAYVAKFNIASGAQVWAKTLNNSNYNCAGQMIDINGTVMATSHYNDDDGDPVISRLDLNGNIQWQRRLDGNGDAVVAVDSEGFIYAAAETWTGDNDGFYIYKFDAEGQTVWRRKLVHGDAGVDGDAEFKNGRAIAVDATHFYLTGYTSGPSDSNHNQFAIKLPKDGSGTGYHGTWLYEHDDVYMNVESNTDYHQSLTESFVSATAQFGLDTSSLSINWWSLSKNTTIEVRDTDGGNIVFADGTTQNTTAQDVPQNLRTGGSYTLSMSDRGKHILCVDVNTGHTIIVPYNRNVPFPVGTTITIVNDSGNDIFIEQEGWGGSSPTMSITSPGVGDGPFWYLESVGVATLLKIGPDRWLLTGSPIGTP